MQSHPANYESRAHVVSIILLCFSTTACIFCTTVCISATILHLLHGCMLLSQGIAPLVFHCFIFYLLGQHTQGNFVCATKLFNKSCLVYNYIEKIARLQLELRRATSY